MESAVVERVDDVTIAAVVAEGIEPPHCATEGSAGLDLRANQDVQLQPMERKLVPTGVRLAIPPGYEAQVRPRSGLAGRHGVSMVTSPGIINSDYRGEIQVIPINLGQDAVEFKRGKRIAQ